MFFIFFFFNDTATTEIYTLSLHDALPISVAEVISFYIFADHGEAYDLRNIALTDSFLLQSLLTLFAGALLLGGMVGLYVRQAEAAGRLGLIGFLLAFFVTVFVVGDFYANTFVTPLVARDRKSTRLN